MKLMTSSAVALFGASAIAVSSPFFIGSHGTQSSFVTSKKVAVASIAKPLAPTPQVVTVQVQAGDSLASIAAANNTSYERLFDANPGITNPDVIYPGQVLRIPAASEQLTPRDLPEQTSVSTVSGPTPVRTSS